MICGKAPGLGDQADLFDVAILGGGPAGAAAALSVKQIDPGLRVLLAEKTAYGAVRIGETLAPGGQALLTGLGCWERFRAEDFLESHGTAASWGRAGIHQNEFLLSARGSGWHLDRTRFDAMLAECALNAGVRVQRRASFVAARRDAGGWRVRLRTDDGPTDIGARFVIDATGRTARFAMGQGARLCRQDRLVGMSVAYRYDIGNPAGGSETMVEAGRDGWWYSAVLPDARLLVAWMSDADLIHAARLRDADAWQAHVGRSGPTRARVQGGAMDGPPQLWAAGTQHLPTPQGDAWVAAGDAACVWDPLSSAGILKALRTGRLAAFVALDAMQGRPDTTMRYTSILRREHAAYLEERRRFYSLEGRWRDGPFWSRRADPPCRITRVSDCNHNPKARPSGRQTTLSNRPAIASMVAESGTD
jgi:flavin-dependent dehydrogenase